MESSKYSDGSVVNLLLYTGAVETMGALEDKATDFVHQLGRRITTVASYTVSISDSVLLFSVVTWSL